MICLRRHVGGIVALLGVYLSVAGGCASAETQADEREDPGADQETDVHAESDILPVGKSPVMGDRASPLTVTLFVDPLDPETLSLVRRVWQGRQAYDGASRVVFNFVPADHRPGSTYAARALVAAHRQGQFSNVFRDVLRAQDRVDGAAVARDVRGVVDESLADAGVTIPDEAWSAAVKRAVRRDGEVAEKVGVEAPPVMFLNGSRKGKTAEGEDVAQMLENTETDLYRKRIVRQLRRREVYRASVKANFEEPRSDQPYQTVSYVPVRDGDPVLGQRHGAAVTVVALIRYGDPQTRSFDAMMQGLLSSEDLGSVRYVIKPLPDHEGEPAAARLALAAEAVGEFEEVHRALLDRGRKVTSAKEAASLISSIDVDDEEALMAAYESEEISHRLRLLGRRGANVHSWPALYVNGLQMDGVPTYLEMRELFEEQASMTVPSRFRGDDVSRYRTAVRRNEEKFDS